MRTTRVVAAGAVALALVVGGAGCGKVAEKVAEKASGCEDIDASGDEVGANCDGVSAGVDADGNVAVTDEDGNSFDASADGTGALPDEWPADLAPPEGAGIVSSTVTDANLSVTAGLDGDVGEVYEGIKTQLEAAGYTIDYDTVSDSGAGQVGSVAASGPEWDANVNVSTNNGDTSLGSVLVVYSLTKVEG